MTYYRPPERESLGHALLWGLLSLLSLLALPLVIRVLLFPPVVWLLGLLVVVALVVFVFRWLAKLLRLLR
jgi:hypothetical protein